MMARNPSLHLSRLAIRAAAITLIICTSLPAIGGGHDDHRRDHRIVNPNSRVDHRTYAEWTAAWWQWATAFPPEINPVIDDTGEDAAQGQSGPVWFLAGVFGGTTVRDVTIPADKYLLLPIINGEWDTVPGFTNPLGLPDPLSVQDIRRIVAFGVDGAEIFCEIDGREVRNLSSYRVRSPVFSMNFDPDLGAAFGYPVQYIRTAVSDGYWLMIRPLSAGTHTIHFTASNDSTGFSLDVTYNITVSP
ncbi:MAG: hypothetical protein JNG88_11765 [Phycisphaerales bacterium]|nr:hypothetical protein [Phycisphaerales bacterium]